VVGFAYEGGFVDVAGFREKDDFVDGDGHA